MSDLPSDAAEADAFEQDQPVEGVPSGHLTDLDPEVPEADAIEQAQVVPDVDDDDRR